MQADSPRKDPEFHISQALLTELQRQNIRRPADLHIADWKPSLIGRMLKMLGGARAPK
jgi:hypothetical protein